MQNFNWFDMYRTKQKDGCDMKYEDCIMDSLRGKNPKEKYEYLLDLIERDLNQSNG